MTCNIRYGTVLPRAIHNLASNPLVLRSRKARSVHFQGRNNGLWTHGLHTGRKLFSGTSIINTQTFKKSEKLSIQQLKEHFLLLQLARTIACEDASVCCGGKIKIENCGAETNSRVENPSKDSDQTIKHRDSLDESVVPTEGYDRLTSPPVVLRWDSSSTRNGRKIILPTVDAQRISDTRAIEDLIKDGAPATFGKGAVEVLDESYRKAIKLDPDQFSTTFHPNDFGITDDIHQTLQTAIAGSGKDCNVATDLLGVRAELYKLNIYSGPSGKFLPHVDTPRATNQIGSLVVCLPSPHEGGQLRVTHQGKDTIWDWSQRSANTIQWAAFYSDCEHEVMPVTSGHRITLTYNLYLHDRVGGVVRQPPTIEVDQYPLHNVMMEALKSPDFMPDGGTLGFYCEHAYAHTNDRLKKQLPHALKGADAIFYTVCRQVGLDVNVKPILDEANDDFYEDEPEDEDDEDEEEWKRYRRECHQELLESDIVGTEFHGVELDDNGGEGHGGESDKDIIDDKWDNTLIKDIVWFNERGLEELATVTVPFGNMPTFMTHYSAAAVLVNIPKFGSKLRQGLAKQQ